MVGVQKNSKAWYSTVSFDGGDGDGKNGEGEESDNDLVTEKPNLQLQGVDPRKGWGFRGVHKVFDISFQWKNLLIFGCSSEIWMALLRFVLHMEV